MLTHSSIEKLKNLEIALECPLRDELNTAKMVDKALEKLLEMSTEGLIDKSERDDIFKTLRSIVQEEDMIAKVMLGNCVKNLDKITEFARRMEYFR
ncbi:MAG: hypothetical protein ACRCS8_00090 [Brevinema sp.]